MESAIRNIAVNVTWNGVLHVFNVYPFEYRNLMSLIYEKIFIDNFGDCKGIGRCGTCHVHVVSNHERFLKRERNENTTLSRMSEVLPNSRLACQILLDRSIDGIHIEVVSDDDPGLY